jgi:heme exporter protein B
VISVLSATRAIFWKELTLELRTRELSTTAGFFAILVTIMSALAFPQDSATAGGAIWLPIAFASVLAVGRSWQREREEGVFGALLLAPIPRSAIFLGKMLAMFALLLGISVVVVATSALFFHIDLRPSLLPLALVVLFGAMTVRTSARELVLAAVMLPLLTPILLVGVTACSRLFEQGGGFATISDYLLIELAFDALFLVGGAGIFGALVEA